MSVQVEIIIFIYAQLRTSCFLFFAENMFLSKYAIWNMLRTRLQCYNPLHHHHPKLVSPETWFQRNKSNFMSNSQLKLCSWERRCIVYWSFWMHFDCNLLFWLGIHCHIISQKSYKETTTPFFGCRRILKIPHL